MYEVTYSLRCFLALTGAQIIHMALSPDGECYMIFGLACNYNYVLNSKQVNA